MRSTFLISVLTCLTFIEASPSKVQRTDGDLPGDTNIVTWPVRTGSHSWTARDPADMTNAERIKKGLPLASPKTRKQKRLSPAPSSAAGSTATYAFKQCLKDGTYRCGGTGGCPQILNLATDGKTSSTATEADYQNYVNQCATYGTSQSVKNPFIAGWYNSGRSFFCSCGWSGQEAPCTNADYNYAQYLLV